MSKLMQRVTFMIKPQAAAGGGAGGGGTHELLAKGARALGWQTEYADIDSLRLEDDELYWDAGGQVRSAGDTDLIWLTSLGERATFWDKMQLLQMAAVKVPVVNSPEAIVFWHSKYRLAELADAELRVPKTYAGIDANWLYEQAKRGGGRWVIKPPAGSQGDGVVVVDSEAADARAQIRGAGFQILQQWVPEVQAGEKRVLLAGGKIIGQYLRTATAAGELTNLARGGQASRCDLSVAERDAMLRLAKRLLAEGVLFAGVDLCWPWLIEVNVVSPGGLATIKELAEADGGDDNGFDLGFDLGSDLGQQSFAAVAEVVAAAVRPAAIVATEVSGP